MKCKSRLIIDTELEVLQKEKNEILDNNEINDNVEQVECNYQQKIIFNIMIMI
jgi:hypothetical protein